MFEVLDYYEGFETIAIVSDISEACEIARQRVADTDGECAVEVFEVATGAPVDWEAN